MTEQVDVKKLPPEVLARHLAKPEGAVGISVIAGLNATNAGLYSAAIRRMRLSPHERLLEIGFGNGREIERFRAVAEDLDYHGVDISETMVAEASALHADAIREGRVTLRLASSAQLPYTDGYFDEALTLNTIYFWPEPRVDLSELRRVIRQGGRLVIGAIAPWSTTTREVFRHGFQFYDQSELKALLNEAHFANVNIDVIKDETTSVDGKRIERDYFIVSAE